MKLGLVLYDTTRAGPVAQENIFSPASHVGIVADEAFPAAAGGTAFMILMIYMIMRLIPKAPPPKKVNVTMKLDIWSFISPIPLLMSFFISPIDVSSISSTP